MRMLVIALVFTVAASGAALAQDATKVPKDSVKLVVIGCVKDRMLNATDVEIPDDSDVPPIRRDTFRLSGKKPVMAEVKRLDGRQLSVTGFVRKIDLQEPGLRVGGGRVIIGAPSQDPARPRLPDTAERPVVLEIMSVEELSGSCTPDRR